MSKFVKVGRKCHICGAKIDHIPIDFNNVIPFSKDQESLCLHNAKELEARPLLNLQQCRRCGYTAKHIENKGCDNVIDITLSDRYEAGYSTKLRAAVSHYVDQSYLQRRAGKYSKAAWSALRAARTADNYHDGKAAVYCRAQALDLFYLAKEHNQCFASSREELILLAEINRRIGQFKVAKTLCRQALKECKSRHFIGLIEFQMVLIEDKDRECRQIDTVIKTPYMDDEEIGSSDLEIYRDDEPVACQFNWSGVYIKAKNPLAITDAVLDIEVTSDRLEGVLVHCRLPQYKLTDILDSLEYFLNGAYDQLLCEFDRKFSLSLQRQEEHACVLLRLQPSPDSSVEETRFTVSMSEVWALADDIQSFYEFYSTNFGI